MQREFNCRVAPRGLEERSVGAFVDARYDVREVADRLMVVHREG
jgi:hypothetical protein